jgi:hypothetical protein
MISRLVIQGILELMFFGVMSLAVLIAILASRGLPKRFDRDMYWTCFAASGIAASLLFLAIRRMNVATVGTQLLERILLGVLLFLLGVSLGCGAGVVTFRKAKPNAETANSTDQSSTEP